MRLCAPGLLAFPPIVQKGFIYDPENPAREWGTRGNDLGET